MRDISAELHAALPRDVRTVCHVLHEAGESAWVVGGSVRDVIAGREPGDWDVATTAVPDRAIELFHRVIPTGVQHGTVTVLVGGRGIEVTTLRGDGAYSDGRRPDRVRFLGDIREDLARRDFTVNAIAYDPAAGRLHDPFDGAGDIERRLLRAVGDPPARFAEDSLRVLRGARFAATLGFRVEPATRDAIAGAAHLLERDRKSTRLNSSHYS